MKKIILSGLNDDLFTWMQIFIQVVVIVCQKQPLHQLNMMQTLHTGYTQWIHPVRLIKYMSTIRQLELLQINKGSGLWLYTWDATC